VCSCCFHIQHYKSLFKFLLDFYCTKICKLIMYLDLSGISARIAFKYYFFLSLSFWFGIVTDIVRIGYDQGFTYLSALTFK
jgi:hypothetical protein